MEYALGSPSCAIFYVTDAGYAFPTLVSALGVRRQVDAAAADVRVVLTDVPGEMVARLAAFLEPYDIQVTLMPVELYSGFDLSRFNKTHVPRSSLGRFFMLECSPGSYDHVVYLDGDTWISGDVRPLINYRPPAGMIAAAEDVSYYFRNNVGQAGRAVRSYFKGLGIDGNRGYFNNGVLSASVETWNDLSRKAFDFFSNNPSLCLYHDQSAMNAVSQDRRVRLSPCWNFVDQYSYWDLESKIPPRIHHFAGGAKPWTGRFYPWENIHDGYHEYFRLLETLNLSRKVLSPDDAAREDEARRAYKKKMDTQFYFRKFNSRRDALAISRRSVLAP